MQEMEEAVRNVGVDGLGLGRWNMGNMELGKRVKLRTLPCLALSSSLHGVSRDVEMSETRRVIAGGLQSCGKKAQTRKSVIVGDPARREPSY